MKHLLFVSLAVISMGLMGCSATSTSSGTTIKGQIEGANDLKVFIDKSKLNNQNMALLQVDADNTGAFEANFEEGLEPGVYRVRIGAQKAFFILDGSEKRVDLTGNISDLKSYDFNVKGSKTAAAFVDAMQSAQAQPNADAMKSYAEKADPIAAMRFSLSAMKGDPAYMEVYKGITKRLEEEYPDSEYANGYKAHISRLEKSYLARMARERIKVGMPAPDITLDDPNGKPYSLSDLKGNVVLLDFWASWCGPCRRANPHVVSVYEKYKDQGFTVFSVSLDGLDARSKARMPNADVLEKNMANSKKRWVDAIKKDKLTWEYHVSELAKWDTRAAKMYGVSGIPKTFLIDRDGKIAAVNPRNNLEQALTRIL